MSEFHQLFRGGVPVTGIVARINQTVTGHKTPVNIVMQTRKPVMFGMDGRYDPDIAGRAKRGETYVL